MKVFISAIAVTAALAVAGCGGANHSTAGGGQAPAASSASSGPDAAVTALESLDADCTTYDSPPGANSYSGLSNSDSAAVEQFFEANYGGLPPDSSSGATANDPYPWLTDMGVGCSAAGVLGTDNLDQIAQNFENGSTNGQD